MVEMNIALRTIELWEAGKIDMVLCAYSSTMPLLDEKGVPNYFLYPVKNQLESQIKELLAQIKLENTEKIFRLQLQLLTAIKLPVKNLMTVFRMPSRKLQKPF